MVIIWGAPLASGASEVISDWDTCIDKCLEEDSCVFLERTDQDGCNLYRFGSISKAEKLDASSGKKIAIKLEMDSDTCPISPDPPLFGKSSGSYEYSDLENDILYSTTINSDGSFLNSYYNISYPPCPLGSRRFTRGDTKVCLQIRFFTEKWCANHTEASALCRESNGISLTGHANAEEYQYFLDQSTLEIVMATGTPEKYRTADILIWIDGWCHLSKCEKGDFTMEDDTHNGDDAYSWFTSSRSSAPNDGIDACPYFPYKGKIDDQPCNRETESTYCFRGAACRIEPTTPFV